MQTVESCEQLSLKLRAFHKEIEHQFNAHANQNGGVIYPPYIQNARDSCKDLIQYYKNTHTNYRTTQLKPETFISTAGSLLKQLRVQLSTVYTFYRKQNYVRDMGTIPAMAALTITSIGVYFTTRNTNTIT